MSKQLLTAVVALVVGVVIGAAVLTAKPQLGGVTIESETFVGPVAFQGGVTSSGNETLSNDLLLTKSPFCVEFYATSSATLNKLVASTTATVEGSDGVMLFTYGSCQS